MTGGMTVSMIAADNTRREAATQALLPSRVSAMKGKIILEEAWNLPRLAEEEAKLYASVHGAVLLGKALADIDGRIAAMDEVSLPSRAKCTGNEQDLLRRVSRCKCSP
jgi:hypothetical protein